MAAATSEEKDVLLESPETSSQGDVEAQPAENDAGHGHQLAGASSGSFLKQEKSRIYTARDFASKGLASKHKIALGMMFVVVVLVLKALFVDPFRVDKERWTKTKEIVDEAIIKAVAAHEIELGPNKTTSLFELEKAAEDFVKQEEGI